MEREFNPTISPGGILNPIKGRIEITIL